MKKNIKNIDSSELQKDVEKIWQVSMFDVLGSYTGNAKNDEKPVQDQDDL